MSDYLEEIAPLTEEQSAPIMTYWRLLARPCGYQALAAMQQFKASMNELQRTAGESHKRISEISQAILDMAEGQNE